MKFPRGISIIYFHILDQLHCVLCNFDIIYVSIALHIFFRYIGKRLWSHTLNKFCLLSNPPPYPTPLPQTHTHTHTHYQPESNKKNIPFMHCISSRFLRYFCRKNCIFYFLMFLLDFTSAGIIFHKFLELHST